MTTPDTSAQLVDLIQKVRTTALLEAQNLCMRLALDSKGAAKASDCVKAIEAHIKKEKK